MHTEYATLTSHVYSYPLQLLEGTEEVTVHSATNTLNHRSDVGKFVADRIVDRVLLNGEATDEHSWFPPHKWTPAYCLKCGALLGWAFSKPETGNVVEFFGFILTKLKPRKASERELTLMLALSRLRIRSNLLARIRNILATGTASQSRESEAEAEAGRQGEGEGEAEGEDEVGD